MRGNKEKGGVGSCPVRGRYREVGDLWEMGWRKQNKVVGRGATD